MRKTFKLFIKSKKFEHGAITEMNGVPFFRKVFWYPEKKDETDMSQLAYNGVNHTTHKTIEIVQLFYDVS